MRRLHLPHRFIPFLQAAALAALLISADASSAQELRFEPGPSMTMELHNARWFDGKEMRRGTLYVKDGRFTSQKLKKVERRMDFRGQYLVSPLAEAHNLNLQSSWGFGRYAQSYLRDGVFYAAMLCGEPKSVAPLRELSGQPDSPDVLFNTACITAADGYPLGQLAGLPAGDKAADKAAFAARLAEVVDKSILVIDSPDQLAQKWPLVAPRKSEMLTLMLNRSEAAELRADPRQFGRIGLRPELVAPIVKRAHQDGLHVWAHIETAADFALAVQAGVDVLAHLPGYLIADGASIEAYRISAEAAAEAARHKTAVITGTAAATLFKTTPEQLAAVRRLQADNLKTLAQAGVPLWLGSDTFNGTALAEWRSLVSLGALDAATLLRIATIDTPRALFPKRHLACFEPGCEASFLVLAANPLQDPSALERIHLRIKQGRILTLPGAAE